MKKLYNLKGFDRAFIEHSPAENRIAVVFAADFCFEQAAAITMETVKRCGAESVRRYVSEKELRVYEAECYYEHGEYDKNNAAFVSVGKPENRRKFLVLGLPGSCISWFENLQKFNEWVDNCPFSIKIIMLK